MHPKYDRANQLSRIVIGAAIEVHREFGPGLLESLYEWFLKKEVELRNMNAVNQKVVRIEYKGFRREEPLRFDLLIDECLLVEVKAVEQVLPIHKAQLLSYMKLLDIPIGLLINFNTNILKNGISRMVLQGAKDA